MTVAYLDTSAVVAVLFGEPRGRTISRTIAKLSAAVSSNLLEAELRSTILRESMDVELVRPTLGTIQWVLPDRTLSKELGAVLSVGYLRGADLWHVASALYFAPDPTQLLFLTLDDNQQRVAAKMGFRVSLAQSR